MFKNIINSITIVISILIFVYAVFITKDLYTSNVNFIIKDFEINKVDNSILGTLSGSYSNREKDSEIFKEYILSQDMLNKINKKFNIYDYYLSDKSDLVNRIKLYFNSKDETFLKIYRESLSINYKNISTITTASFAFYEPHKAQEILNFIVASGIEFLNEQNSKNANNELKFIKERILENKKIVEQDELTLRDIQKKSKMIDPVLNIQMKSGIISSLTEKNINYKSELEYKKTFMNKTSNDIILLSNKIKEINKEIELLKKDIYAKDGNLIFKFDELKTKLDFSRKIYHSSLELFENLQIEVMKKDKIINIISNPTIPKTISYPNVIYLLLKYNFILISFYWIITTIIKIIKER